MRAFSAVLLFTFVCLSGCSKASARPESWLTESDLLELGAVSKDGAEALRQGDVARQDGDVDRAIRLYREAAIAMPARDVPGRFECLLQTERGRQAEAIEACRRATDSRNTMASRRALAGALITGATAPTPSELGRASSLADTLLTSSRQSPYGYAVLVDIARLTGDDEMLEANLEQLHKFAPQDYETLRLERLLRETKPPKAFYIGWVAFIALLSLTLGHALFRFAARRASRVTARVASVATLVVLSFSAVPAQAEPEAASADAPPSSAVSSVAETLSEWPIDDENPESSVPSLDRMNRNPIQAGYFLMDLTSKAQQAHKAGAFSVAVKYWRAVAKMVPDSAVGLARMCEDYEAMGETEKAIQSCSMALTRDGVKVEDYSRFARVVIAHNSPKGLNAEQVKDLDEVVQHLQADPSNTAAMIAGEHIQCELGFHLSDQKRLSECTAALVKRAPNDPQTVSYEWTLALLQKDYGRAERLIRRASDLGLDKEVLEKMRAVTLATIPWWRRPMSDWRTLPALAALAGSIALMALVLRRRKAPAPATAAAPSVI